MELVSRIFRHSSENKKYDFRSCTIQGFQKSTNYSPADGEKLKTITNGRLVPYLDHDDLINAPRGTRCFSRVSPHVTTVFFNFGVLNGQNNLATHL